MYICVCVCVCVCVYVVQCLVAQSCPILCDPKDCSLPGSSVHGDSPGKNTGLGCHALLVCVCVCIIGVQLIYNVVLLTGVQQSELVIHISTLFFFFIFSLYRPLNIYPCASRSLLAIYFICSFVYISIPISQFISSTTLNPW